MEIAVYASTRTKFELKSTVGRTGNGALKCEQLFDMRG